MYVVAPIALPVLRAAASGEALITLGEGGRQP